MQKLLIIYCYYHFILLFHIISLFQLVSCKLFVLIVMQKNEIGKQEKSFFYYLNFGAKINESLSYSFILRMSIFFWLKILVNKNFFKRKLKVTKNHLSTKQHLSWDNLMK